MPKFTNEYYINITESLFKNFGQSGESGVCIYIDLGQTIAYISHCVFANNKYYDGALYVQNAVLVHLSFICFHNNEGYRGSHFCYTVASVLVNYTNEVANHDFHGPLISGYQICHFNYNNVSNSEVATLAPWHFWHQHSSSITKFNQMSDTDSKCISSSDMSGSAVILQYFNFLNCHATTLNGYTGSKGQLIYTKCVFMLSSRVAIGHPCTFNSCYSNGTVLSNNVESTTGIHQLVFPDIALCMNNRENIDNRKVLLSRFVVVMSSLLSSCGANQLLSNSSSCPS